LKSTDKKGIRMSNRTIIGILLATATSLAVYVNPNGYGQGYGQPYGNPYYNNYAYRGYAPPGEYGYYHHHNHAARDMAIGAGIGAGIGLMASHHGHRYW
jgi:hypothetical protein